MAFFFVFVYSGITTLNLTNNDVVEAINAQLNNLKVDIMTQVREEVGARFPETLLGIIRDLVGPLVKEIIAAIVPEISLAIKDLVSHSV